MGGLNDGRANPQGLFVLRQYDSESVRSDGKGPVSQHMIFSVDLTKADSLFAAGKFQIQPGDIVVASESAVKPVQVIVALVGSLFAVANAF